jgi:predicted ATPase/class 3 adenylate cyclase
MTTDTDIGLPSGIVTFVFSDIEGSTRLLHRLGERYAEVLERHRELLRAAWVAHDGHELSAEGDEFYVAFASADEAVAACVDAQGAVAAERWPDGATVLVRMGVHSGLASPRRGAYVALAVHRGSRVVAAANGGQVLVSEHAVRTLGDRGAVTLRSLGRYRLRDFDGPVELYEAGDGEGRDRPVRAVPADGHNLVRHRDSTVGREQDIAALVDAVTAGRAVTLTGPGGVGKTTLALLAAGAEPTRHPDGTWFMELVSVEVRLADSEDVAECIMTALGLHDAAEHAPDRVRSGAAARLVQELSSRDMLLVLDNCENLAEQVAGLLAVLLPSCPGLRVLATSREPLGVPGERLYPVPPLDSPAGTQPSDVQRSPAGELFLRRAAASVPGFRLTPANAAAVAEVCCRLDGLPLALELAAARLRVLDVGEIAARLDDRFRLLNSGGSGLPARQRTLRAVIDWSWEPLSEQEQGLLRRLSVHPGGFPLVAAEALGADDGLDAADVLDLLGSLVDRSLLVAEPGQHGTRYRLLESVTAYARERLAESGEAEAAHERHALFWADFADDAEERLRGAEQPRTLARLDEDTANLRAAIDWSLDHGRAELALRISGALGWYRYLRGRTAQAGRSLSRALQVPGEACDAVRARALAWHGILGLLDSPSDLTLTAALDEALRLYRCSGDEKGLARTQALIALLVKTTRFEGGDLGSAEELVDGALDIAQRTGDAWGTAAAQLARGWECLRRGELTGARTAATQANTTFTELGDVWGKVRGAHLLGILAEIVGDYAEALDLHRAGLACTEELGLDAAAAEELVRLGRLAILSGDYAAADGYHEEVLRRTAHGTFTAAASYARGGLGMSARRQGRLEEAEELLRQNLALHTAEGYQPGRASVLAELGFAAEMRGDAVEARALHLEGLAAAQETEDPRAVAQALEGVAGADALEGAASRAALLLGAAAAARRGAGAPQPTAERFDVDRITTAARTKIGEDEFEAEYRTGERTPLRRAAAQAAVDREASVTPNPAVSGGGAR